MKQFVLLLNLVMKRLLPILCLLLSLSLSAQERYVVDRAEINVQAEFNYSPIIGVLVKGDTVTVFESLYGIAKIDFEDGYGWVELNLLGEIGGDVEGVELYKRAGFISNFAVSGYLQSLLSVSPSSYSSTKIILIICAILIISIVIYISRFKLNFTTLRGMKFLLKYTLFVTLVIIELLYFTLVDDPFWFCRSYNVGLAMALINFTILIWVIYNQIVCFLSLMVDCADSYHTHVNFKLGYYSWMIGFVLVMICYFYYIDFLIYVIIAQLLLQSVQFVFIIRACAKGRGIIFSIPYIFIYVIGALTISFIFIQSNFSAVILFVYYLIMLTQGALTVKKNHITIFDENDNERKLYKCGSNAYKDNYGGFWVVNDFGMIERDYGDKVDVTDKED